MLLGTVSILAALVLLLYNGQEAAAAGKAATDLMPKLISEIDNNEAPSPSDADMDTVTIDGQAYIGYLLVPSLGLELPIMYDWSYPQLRTAPCRFSGTLKEDNLVLLAHNYTRHFGRLRALRPGKSIYFRDVHGVVTQYEVVAVDRLPSTAVEEMTAGNFDLTLFTCTYNGQRRVTVRCNRT